MLIATGLMLLMQAQAPLLEVHAGGTWHPWSGGAAGTSAREPMLASAISWSDSAPGLRAGSFEVRSTGSGALRNSIAIIELDPRRLRFDLGRAPPDARRTATDWVGEDSSVVLAANTGLFRTNGSSQGLVFEHGTRYSALAGWLDAVVVLDTGGIWFTDVAGGRELPRRVSAFQTLPFLVRGGRVVFGETSGLKLSRTHRDRRITLCLGDDGLVRLLLSNFEVFGVTAGTIPIGLTIPEQALIAAGAGCRDAVALDGGISSQIAFRAGDRIVKWPGWRQVPLMLLARRR
ncbi:MAG TPA: phosphodiester glycosidase family protein [Gemmatimonadales bacterium]|jgi:hypothetical protein